VETLGDDIASMCLEDLRVRSVRVRIEKLDVFEDATSVGVEIERFATKI
ncbi:MAG: dihydroneopterin aldolase, partial [Rhodospirillales bacterium]